MAAKYSNLEELKRKKELLKKEVADLESLITFDNTKESLSVITHGFTDKYLLEQRDENGELKVAINKGSIIKNFTSMLTSRSSRRNPIMGFTQSAMESGSMGDIVKLGAVALVGSYAKKKMSGIGWKNKVLGVALIYFLPIGLKYVRKKLEEYQRKQSISSMEKLI